MEEDIVEEEVALKPHLFDESFVLPAEISPAQLSGYIQDLKSEIGLLEDQVNQIQKTRKKAPGSSEEEYEVEIFDIPPHCVPIKSVIAYYIFKRLGSPQKLIFIFAPLQDRC
jgi:hypothetical protein